MLESRLAAISTKRLTMLIQMLDMAGTVDPIGGWGTLVAPNGAHQRIDPIGGLGFLAEGTVR